jgi:hypothetical protein
MRTYHLDLQNYARTRIESGNTSFAKNISLCERPIRELCARYDIKGKTVLSLGAGDAFEEYWMAVSDNRLTLVDITDPVAEYEAALSSEVQNDRYIVGDAGEFVDGCEETFDILYISSLHPDEIRREELQADFVKTRTFMQAVNHRTWKAGTEAYHPIIERALRLVKSDGLIILQHYRGGLDIRFNPDYVADLERQFGRHGVRVVELHHFRASPAHLLVTARLCDRHSLSRFRVWLMGCPEITIFHGRYDNDINKDVVRIDDAPPPEHLALSSRQVAKRTLRVALGWIKRDRRVR